MPESTAADLIAHARETHVAVIGSGIAGLVAALECAKVGIAVTVFEAAPHPGGALAGADVDGLRLDLAADGFAPGDPALTALLDELGLGAEIVTAPSGVTWISGLPGGAAPLPADSLLGIPANPWADDVRRFIGWRGAWRAYLDRLRPPLTIGHEQRLGKLVRGRMGDRVADRMVAPLARGMFGLDPDQLDVDELVPGLNTALTRVGSLSGAVTQHLPERPERATLAGGMARLVDALVTRIAELDGEVRVGVPITGLARTGKGWQLRSSEAEEPVTVDAVIVATGEAEARRLLGSALPTLAEASRPVSLVDIVTLVVTAPALDKHPRGVAVYPVPGTSTALAVNHLTAAWPALADAAGAGRHVVRVTLPTEETVAPELPVGAEQAMLAAVASPGTKALPAGNAAETAAAESALVAEALGAASSMLDVDLGPGHLSAARWLRTEWAPPASTLGHAAKTAAVRSSVHAVDVLAVVGAWAAGSDLDDVVADARAEAERIRQHVLWGRP
ncbi:protoporphyrinogen/coproporphyrinogen oxidase [Microbacterium invictum]|uniref:Oxygen-dependent protoporphyrinogen oxidase n=1 Tax=Microbacterium invictum TaxID=515415 RepID=A0AA40SRR3_9MICO|nr:MULTISPECIES: FAD-dependent oxidoreductase [Microbacterium]MBB4141054.1 oxygen-dependent protoporphyrinogen oxidase [Microbacterium invictum]